MRNAAVGVRSCPMPDPQPGQPGVAVGRRRYALTMPSFIKTVTFDCAEPLKTAAFWASALGSNVDEDSTSDKAFVEAAGWGGPNLWFNKVPEPKSGKNRIHFDLRAPGSIADEVSRLEGLGATVIQHGQDLVVMQDVEGNEFCVE